MNLFEKDVLTTGEVAKICNVASRTVSIAVPLIPSKAAEISVVPTLWPVTTPWASTVAMTSSLLAHVAPVSSSVLSSDSSPTAAKGSCWPVSIMPVSGDS